MSVLPGQCAFAMDGQFLKQKKQAPQKMQRR